jgi:hypothetical protein
MNVITTVLPKGEFKLTERYVLTNKSGKQASRKNQSLLAMVLIAEDEIKAGRGGGLVSALLARVALNSSQSASLRARYVVKKVRCRSEGERGKIRQTILTNHALVRELAHQYKQSGRALYKRNIVGDFSDWIAHELARPGSAAVALVCRHYSAVADRTRPGWWEKIIAERRANGNQAAKETAS